MSAQDENRYRDGVLVKDDSIFSCPSCNTPWVDHLGIQGVCRELQEYKAAATAEADGGDEARAELSKVKAELKQATDDLEKISLSMGFKPNTWQNARETMMHHSVVIYSEMVKARQALAMWMGHTDWDFLYLEGKSGFLLRIWKRMREAERRATLAEQALDAQSSTQEVEATNPATQ